jgi:hypothetical protein
MPRKPPSRSSRQALTRLAAPRHRPVRPASPAVLSLVNEFVKRELQKIDEQYRNDVRRLLEDLGKDGYELGESGVH